MKKGAGGPEKIHTLDVIDFHVHIGLKEHWNERMHSYQKGEGSEFYDRYDEMVNPHSFASYLKTNTIKRAVILPEISPITSGIVPNEYVLDFCRDEEVFVPFCTVNPMLVSHPGREFKKYVAMGAKGLKLYPSYNHFYPNDRVVYPLYAFAEEHRLPVLVHTGSSVFRGAKVKYADPVLLDDVAADFPDLLLLMAHGGRGLWYDQAFFLSRMHPNIYLEISGLPPRNLLTYFPDMEKNIDKFVYGSDWPGIRAIGTNIDAIQHLPLSTVSIKKILYGNAAAILNI